MAKLLSWCSTVLVASGLAGCGTTGDSASDLADSGPGGNQTNGASGGTAVGGSGRPSTNGSLTSGASSSGGTRGVGGSSSDGGGPGPGADGSSGTADAAPAGIDGSRSTDGASLADAGDGNVSIVSSPGPLHFGPNVRVNDDTGTASQEEVTIATANGVLVAGWMDGRETSGSRNGYMCGYSVSRDSGMTWSKNFFASTQGGGATENLDGDPGVSADEAGNIYLAAEDYGAGQIVFASSTDQGMTFTPFANAQSAIDKPWIGAARDGTVFMSWLGYPGGFKRSLDHGKTWGSVSSLGNLSSGTAIASGTNGYVHIPFATDSGGLRYVRSKDWGQTLEAPRDIDSVGTQDCNNNYCEPRDLPIVGCATDPTGQTVAIVWAGAMSGGDGDDDVWAIISKDGGETWSTHLRVNNNQTPSRQFQPWVAVDATGRVHVAWTDLRNGGMNSTYYANALDPSKGFGPNVEVTDKRGAANTFLGDYKGIVVQGSYVVVAWTDTRNGNTDIYSARAKLDGSAP